MSILEEVRFASSKLVHKLPSGNQEIIIRFNKSMGLFLGREKIMPIKDRHDILTF